jgi:hypothetical protein
MVWYLPRKVFYWNGISGRLASMDDKPKYEEIAPRSRGELEAAFASDHENTICNAIYSAAQHDSDWRWAQGELVKLLGHKSLLIRSAAINGLGELVLFRGHVDLELVLPEIEKLRNESVLVPFVKEYLESLGSRITTQ